MDIINHIQFGNGKDVIFLHGWGGDTRSFLGCANAIADKFRVTLIDFYGFGKTVAPNYPLYLDDYVESVVELIKEYGMSQVFLVGHSFGGRVALRMAVKYKDLLAGIVIADGAGIKPHRGLKYYLKVGFHKLSKKLGLNLNNGSTDYKQLNNTMRKTFINIVNEDQTPELSKIIIPTLLIWGDKDRDTPIYMAKRMYRKIPSSSLIIFCGGGHFAYIERHKLFIKILKHFLDGGYEVDYCRSNAYIYKRRIIKIPRYSSKK